VGGLAWLGAVFLRGEEPRVPPELRIRTEAAVSVQAEAEPELTLVLEPPPIAEPELVPVFEELEEIFPVDWMTRPAAHPRREDLSAVERSAEPLAVPEPTPSEPVEDPDPAPEEENPEAAQSDTATVTASSASRVEASYDPDPELSPPPRYPGLAISRGWEGTVLLTATVSATGELLDLVVTRSTGRKILDDAALEAVRNWEPGAFRPATRDGVAVQGEVPIQFRFQIGESDRRS